MTHLLLALSLLAAPAPAPAAPQVAVKSAAPSPAAAAAEATVASAAASQAPEPSTEPVAPPAPIAAPTPIPAASLPPAGPGYLAAPSTPGLDSALPVFLMLAALAGLALYLARRRPSGGRRLVQVLETASLGPKRQLVVVRLRDDLLLLGSSEAGVTLLSTQPAPESLPATADGRPAAVEPPRGERLAGRLAGLWSSLRGGGRAPAPTSFDDLLQETSDDLELRRKLASGRPGRVA